MSLKRNKKGQFLKRGSGGKPAAPARKNPPGKPARKRGKGKKSGMWRKNPPDSRPSRRSAARSAVGEFIAGLVGGAVAYGAGRLLSKAVTSPTAQDVMSILVPATLGVVATRIKHPRAKSAAIGAFGAAGIGVAQFIGDAIGTKSNPPDVFYLENPPPTAREVLTPPNGDLVRALLAA